METGRPTKYNPDRNQEVIDLMAEGGSIMEVAKLLDVSRETIYNWIDKEHASFQQGFFDTYKKGITLSQAWWEEKGRKALENTKFNSTLWMMHMTNRFRQDWKNKQSVEHSTEDNKPLEFAQIVLSRPDKETD